MRKARRGAARRGRSLRIMFADEARFGRMNRPRPCWAPRGVRPSVAAQLIREYIYLYGAVSPKDGTLRLSDHAHLEYRLLPGLPRCAGEKIRQPGHPSGARRGAQPPLRRPCGSQQHLAAVPAALFARTQSRRKISGMKSARRSSRTTRSNPWTPSAPNSNRQSSTSKAIQ